MRIILSRRKLVSSIIGVIYRMAPGNKPRNIDKINQYLIDFCNNNVEDYNTEIDSKDLKKYLKDMLFACKEFTNLNISQKKWDEGVRDYNDQNNRGWGVVAVGHDDNGEPCSLLSPEEYSDFIDLDACVMNIANSIIADEISNGDCFLCKYAKEYMSSEPSDCEQCRSCCINPNYKYNREPHPMSLITHVTEQ